MATVTCKVINFGKGLRYARQYGAYNPATKTWEITSTWTGLNAPEKYGLQIVSQVQNAPTNDPRDPRFDLSRAMEREDSIY